MALGEEFSVLRYVIHLSLYTMVKRFSTRRSTRAPHKMSYKECGRRSLCPDERTLVRVKSSENMYLNSIARACAFSHA